MRYVDTTFRAIPCNETNEQLFTAWYEVTPCDDRLEAWKIIPGTLRQLTQMAVIDFPHEANVTQRAETVSELPIAR